MHDSGNTRIVSSLAILAAFFERLGRHQPGPSMPVSPLVPLARQAGTVTLNCQLVFDHGVPFGGYQQSGWGHEFGREGVEAYIQTKSVWAQL
jgi:hypothetical protein